MVCIVKSVQKIAVERVDILETGEAIDGGGNALGEGLGSVFDFSRVESPDTTDLEARTNLRRKSALSVAVVSICL